MVKAKNFYCQETHNFLTQEIVSKGIMHGTQERILITSLSVEENLLLGAYTLDDKGRIREMCTICSRD